MLLYTKIEMINGKPVRRIYGTTENIPSEEDKEIELIGIDGSILEINDKDTYVDDGHGGIIRLSDNKFVAIDVTDTEGGLVNVIPGDWKPEFNLTTAALTDDDIDLFGKVASDLQSAVTVSEDAITGTLHYVDDYTGFSSIAEEQAGNYLALKCTAIEGATITVEVVNGTKGPVTLDPDGLIVLRLINKDTQSIKVTATINNITETKIYSLSQMTFEPESTL